MNNLRPKIEFFGGNFYAEICIGENKYISSVFIFLFFVVKDRTDLM